eukprot:CAMPEP_0119417462 /NCGR_PEP_ID=MMETSP1335-20130426/15880_1 /TAXON_ID=259385 /ORGANISM="Chrysoculter rhomboideus, Strain RCC1486" /LENGTH=73 /DNA_ID=CAMNT_0007442643 /DNA_START=36 /DNA_END=257 /DNA_ORIENTATION=-
MPVLDELDPMFLRVYGLSFDVEDEASGSDGMLTFEQVRETTTPAFLQHKLFPDARFQPVVKLMTSTLADGLVH